uniref:hypothetical protein n=1 Tax=Heterobasidion annosum TaxID=13563 RepID=UPI00257D2A34|nr:hypothetical protein QU374_mgp13 [Heterobasidion annosum]WHL55367.1 hypothetical protein [Heterobasidion annosum]
MFKFNFLFNNIFYSDGYKILTLFNLFILRHLLRLSATFNIFYLTFVLYLEFLCTGFVLSFVFIKWYGLLSKVIKFLISKINYHSIKWWIKCLLLFLVILTIGIFSTNIVYLDFNSTFVQVLDNSVTVKISGDLIKDIINHVGAASAFMVGVQICATILAKTCPTSKARKIVISIGAVVGSYTTFELTGKGTKLLTGKYDILENNNNITINTQDIEYFGEEVKTQTKKTIQDILPKLIGEDKNINFNLPTNKHTLNHSFWNTNNINITHNPDKSNILERVENSHSTELFTSLKENANTTTDFNDVIIKFKDLQIIPSPLEPTEGGLITKLQDILEVLNLGFYLNLITAYLICMLIILISVKIIKDKNFNLDIIKTYPLGNFIFYILNKLIKLGDLIILFEFISF